MEFLLIGTIKSIKSIKFGCCVRVRETQIGGTTKNGHDVGTYDYTWDCVTSSDALVRYINKFFRVGATVIIKGRISQSINTDEDDNGYKSDIHKIETINLWNIGDPKKEKNREKYNSKIVGDNKPNIDNNFEKDF